MMQLILPLIGLTILAIKLPLTVFAIAIGGVLFYALIRISSDGGAENEQ